MKDTPLSNCERRFLLRAIEEKKRLDGRHTYDYRSIKIAFGTDYGCCVVELGKTRVLGQVSCDLVSPKLNRATEGILFFNLELSQMAAPAFEPGRQSDLLVKLNRLLERCLRNSKCIDTESLCVVAGEKVWQIRVDLHLLNHDGNIIDAASIAAIVALCHFRRPDVSVQGDEVTLVLRCSKIAGVKVAEITELIQKALENDQKVRKEGGKFGFAESIADHRITAFKMEKAPIDTSDVEEKAEEIIAEAEPPSEVVSEPVLWTPGTAQIGEGIENSWGDLEGSEREDEDEGGRDEAVVLDSTEVVAGAHIANIGGQDTPIVLTDSEEEEMIVLEPDKNPKKIR
ncbi:exosome complex component RRP45 isoform X2 [Tamandua tetradactyla]|uniref:exosome complex component RRP45 isoform X2 n=1 Tax=Tamandua tetradactyla TaxID=48850 RepID=UPI00405487ED